MLTPKNKLLIGIAGSVVAIVGISVGTFFVLHGLRGATEPDVVVSEKPALTTASDSAAVLAAYKKDAAVLKQIESYKERTVRQTNATITYTPENATYAISKGVMELVQYDRTDKEAAKNVESLLEETSKVLVGQKLLKTTTDTTIAGITTTTYDSLNTLCVTTAIDKFGSTPASFGLACAPKSLFTETATAVNKLFELPSVPKSKTVASLTPSEIITEGNKSLQTIQTVYSDKTGTVLIFAAIDGSWSYVGQRALPNVDDKESYKISSELKAAINQSKWNGFLTKYITAAS